MSITEIPNKPPTQTCRYTRTHLRLTLFKLIKNIWKKKSKQHSCVWSFTWMGKGGVLLVWVCGTAYMGSWCNYTSMKPQEFCLPSTTKKNKTILTLAPLPATASSQPCNTHITQMFSSKSWRQSCTWLMPIQTMSIAERLGKNEHIANQALFKVPLEPCCNISYNVKTTTFKQPIDIFVHSRQKQASYLVNGLM